MPGDRRLAPLIAALALFALASQSDQFSSSRDGGASSLLAEDAAPPTEGSSSVLASAADHAGATAADATATDDVGAAWGGQYDDYTSEYRGATDSPFELEIDLRQFKTVQEFLKRKGIGPNSTTDEILQFVPASIVVRMWPDRVRGELGADAQGGYVAFSILQPSSTDTEWTDATYLIVMRLTGEIEAVKIFEHGSHEYGAPRIDGLKMRDPSHLLLAWNIDPTKEEGPGYVYDWREDWLVELANGAVENSHDIQWEGNDTEHGNAHIWRPTSSSGSGAAGCFRQDTVTGETLETFTVTDLKDVNHCQVLTDGPYAILGARESDCFAKYDRTTGEALFIVGGAAGTLPIVDFNGVTHEPGVSLFYGQHNLEYMGEGEYMMFDNNFNVSADSFHSGGGSRLLVVSVDEAASIASLTWELQLEDHTPIYGDCDRLPSGNLLASSWPDTINADASFQYDVRFFETVRATKQPAWEAFVVGRKCTAPADGSAGCVRSGGAVPSGWSTYSVERFYTAPLVTNITCDAGVTGTWLSFTAHNNFKQNALKPGTYEVALTRTHAQTEATDDGGGGAGGAARRRGLASGGGSGAAAAAAAAATHAPGLKGGFQFEPHWRDTHVTIDLSDIADAGGAFNGTLSVLNEWGDRTTKHVTCQSQSEPESRA